MFFHKNRRRILESATPLSGKIDREKNTVYGVKLLGVESLNGRRYPPEMLAMYKDLYEGVKVHLDHAERNDWSRSVTSCFGFVRNVDARPDGLYADFVYNPKHPQADQIIHAIEFFPENLGFSPSHEVEMAPGSEAEVTKIVRVLSVDLVDSPATTHGIFESENLELTKPNGKEKRMEEELFWNAMTLDSLKKNRPDLVEAIVRETKDVIDKENDFLSNAVCSDVMDDAEDSANA